MLLLLATVMRWQVRLSTRKLGLIVCYHEIGDPGGDRSRDLMPAVSTHLFGRQLEHLRGAYRVVPLDALIEGCEWRRRGERVPVAVTFDDDLPSHAAKAMPELKRAAIPASFFVCGASLQNPFSYWWEDLQRYVDAGGDIAALGATNIHDLANQIERSSKPQHDSFVALLKDRAPPPPANAGMRGSEVRTLAEEGFQVGFHTRGHYLLTTLGDDQLERELRDGRRDVERAAGQPMQAIAYPHGKADSRIADAARRAGYRLGLTVSGEPVDPSSNQHLLSRINASPDSCARFAFDLARTLTCPAATP